MLLFRLFCATVTIVAVCSLSQIPHREINIKLLDERMESFQWEMRHSLNAAKNFQKSTGGAVVIDDSRRFLTIFSIFAPDVVPYLVDHMAYDSEFRRTLVRAIPDDDQRRVTEKDIRTMESAMETILQNIRLLTMDTDLSSESERIIVHIIQDNLNTIVNKFSHEESIFRKYPLIAMPPLYAIATFITIYDPVAKIIVPSFKSKSLTSCQFLDTLKEYRALAVHERLKQIEVMSLWSGKYFDTAEWTGDVERQTYNILGYSKLNTGLLKCDRGCDRDKKSYHEPEKDRCLKDRLNYKHYYAGQKYESYNCVLGYMELVRHRMEKSFEEPISLVENRCTDLARNQPRETTGYGWLTIRVDRFLGKVDTEGAKCDDDIIGFNIINLCDPYVRILVNGEEHFRTSIKHESDDAYFNESFKSKRISKSSDIRIEVWDEDKPSKDDLMFRIDTNIHALLDYRRIFGNEYRNEIFITSKWKDEFDQEQLLKPTDLKLLLPMDRSDYNITRKRDGSYHNMY